MDFINIDGSLDELQIEIVPVDTSVSQNWERATGGREKEREKRVTTLALRFNSVVER